MAGCCSARNCFASFFSLLEICGAGILVAIVAMYLSHTNVAFTDDFSNPVSYNATCSIGKEFHGHSLCTYAYIVAGVSIGVSLLLTILLCCTCNGCGIGPWFEVIFALALTGWWVVAGLVFSKYGAQANKSLPLNNWRNGIIVVSWLTAGIFLFHGLVSSVEVCRCIANCCSCCAWDNVRDKYRDRQREREERIEARSRPKIKLEYSGQDPELGQRYAAAAAGPKVSKKEAKAWKSSGRGDKKYQTTADRIASKYLGKQDDSYNEKTQELVKQVPKSAYL